MSEEKMTVLRNPGSVACATAMIRHTDERDAMMRENNGRLIDCQITEALWKERNQAIYEEWLVKVWGISTELFGKMDKEVSKIIDMHQTVKEFDRIMLVDAAELAKAAKEGAR
jgi:hypothetical protein